MQYQKSTFSELFREAKKTRELRIAMNVVYREFDHQRVHDAPDYGHEVKRVPTVLEVTLPRNIRVNSFPRAKAVNAVISLTPGP